VLIAARRWIGLDWQRLDTGSIWPSVITHAAWNAIINGGFSLLTSGVAAKMWVGESGILVVLVLVGASLLWRHLRPSSQPAAG
jgi:uncharacterized protein